MDPIMKFLEDDEDDTVHSGADVDAFTAALNRDIVGDASTSQPSDSDGAAISQGSSNTSSQFLSQWQPSSNNENAIFESKQDPLAIQQQGQYSSDMELKRQASGSDSQLQQDNSSQVVAPPAPYHEPSPNESRQQLQAEQDVPPASQGMHVHQPDRTTNKDGESESMKLQSMSDQQALSSGISTPPAVGTGMGNQQAVAAGVGYHHPMATMVNNQQVMGTGINSQLLGRSGVSHQQSTTSLVNNQQSTTSGMSNHPSTISGMSGQPPSRMGMSNQQSVAMGMSNQQPVAVGASNQQSLAVGTSNQQLMVTGSGNQQSVPSGTNQQTVNALNRSKQVPFALLLPVLQPVLDRDKGMQLQSLYEKLKKNEITKDAFVRHMRTVVGDQMLKMAVYRVQQQAARNSRATQQHMQVPSNVQVPTESSIPRMDGNATQTRETERQGESHGLQASSMTSPSLNASSQERDRPAFPVQGLNKQQQQHLHFSQASFPTFGSTGSNYHPSPTSNVSTSAASLKQQAHDPQMRQIPAHQSMSGTQLGTTPQAMNMMNAPKLQNSFSEQKRTQAGTLTHMTSNSSLQPSAVQWHLSNKEQRNGVPSSMTYVKQEPIDQSNEQQPRLQLSATHGLSSFPSVHTEYGSANSGTPKDDSFEVHSSRLGVSTSSSMVTSTSVASLSSSQMDHNLALGSRIPSVPTSIMQSKSTVKKPSIGQKKPLETLGSSPPPSSKKQKVSGAFLDQSIEQLNDVTAVSGVNLREEEEQLFSGTKEDGRVSEASRRVVQEEEERLILQKTPLQKKLAEIMAKCGLKGIGSDVEKCLSLCVEERMRGLMSNLIRLSKQRLDIEKPRHRTIITSDVRQQIMTINRKAREEWEKKQAEAEKLQKLNEPDGSSAVDGEKDKDDTRARPLKVNKEEDEKTRTNAANVAARAAVGGDDMLSKWQLMAEQARQKREGVMDTASVSQAGKDVSRKPSSATGRSAGDHQQNEKRGTPGTMKKIGRNQAMVPQNRIVRTISVKDIIAVLEREPQMSKSALIYRLYEKIRSEASTE